jgi:hypothetical protein
MENQTPFELPEKTEKEMLLKIIEMVNLIQKDDYANRHPIAETRCIKRLCKKILSNEKGE